MNEKPEPRLVGITVLPEYVQSEGIEAVLDRLQSAGCNAVTTSPYVMEPADEKTGQREPPADAGAGAVRLLDRPLWGKRELFVRTAPSFAPEMKLYQGLRYRPAAPTDLTRRQGRIVGDFLRAAQARHMKVFLQVQAAIPPGYRVQFGGPLEEDRPRLPDGRLPPRRLAKNGSLASPHILDYQRALIRDLVRAYPTIDGIRFDWPEYPPYFLDDWFLDFSDPARRAAERAKFDFERMRQAAAALYRKMHGDLRDADLEGFLEGDGGRFFLIRALADHPGLGDWLRFKAHLVREILQLFRRTMDEAGGKRLALVPNAFPPPWTLGSGMYFRHIAGVCQGASVKLYTMHWAMMIRFYGEVLRKANPRLSDRALTRFLVRALDLADDDGLPNWDRYRYPGPNEAHPVGLQALARKVRQAQQEAGSLPIHVLAHGYGPVADFRRRLEAGWRTGRHGLWVNRYAYLSDEKLKTMRAVVGR